MKRPYAVWQVLLWIIALYHGAIGLILLGSGDQALKLAKSLAGMTLTGSPELGIIGEIFGCYLLAFALLMAAAAWNPVKNRAAVTIGLLLFVLRVVQRVVFAEKVMTVFQIPPVNYWVYGGVVLLLGGALGVFRWKLYRDMHGTSGA
jgi:hypothetical protein